MKNLTIIKTFIIFFFLTLTSKVLAVDITVAGKQFRNDIQNFLRQEGYSPWVDDDGSLCFKQEGNKFWIDIEGEKPFYVQFFREGYSADNVNEIALLKAINKCNTGTKALKCCYYGTGISLACESFCHNSEDFKYVFYKYLSILNYGYEQLGEEYNSINGGSTSSSGPLSISSVDIGITDQNYNIITSYGSTLYSSKTKYLTPQIKVTAKSAGTYEIYCKFYDANGTLSTGSGSPSGYSWKHSVYISQGTNTYKLIGWGSNTSGHWRSGNYRMEFYYQGKLLTTKYFTVN
jgi:hypothetical protein